MFNDGVKVMKRGGIKDDSERQTKHHKNDECGRNSAICK